MIKTSPNNLPSLIKVLKNVISYDISRCYLCRRLSRAISSPVVLIVVGKQGIRQMVDSWWSETKEKVYGYRITSDPFLWSYSFNKNNVTVCFLRKIVIIQFSKILIMTNTRCDVIKHLIKKAYFSPFLKLLLRNYSTSTNSYYQG